MIGPGDTVVCIREIPTNPQLPQIERPVVGEVYTVTSVYPMDYGLGCTLEGVEPFPYKGYFLLVERDPFGDVELGWYFRRLEPIEIGARTRELETQ